MFVDVGLVRRISQGHGHCDVAAALLERKADKAEWGLQKQSVGPVHPAHPMVCQVEQCDCPPSYPFYTQMMETFIVITFHHNPYWLHGTSDPKHHLQTREVHFQADINHRSSSQLTALSAACERGSALDAGCSRQKAAGSGSGLQSAEIPRYELRTVAPASCC